MAPKTNREVVEQFVKAVIAHPDGSRWQLTSLVELRAGKIARTTDIYGAAFDPPAWRAQWVERIT